MSDAFGEPEDLEFGGTASPGVSAQSARADHTHGLPEISVGREYVDTVSYDDDPSFDNTAILQAAATTARANGQKMLLRPERIGFASQLNLSDSLNIGMEGSSARKGHLGVGSSLAASEFATTLLYTGTATPAINCRSSFGLSLDGIRFMHNNAAFTGTMIDLDWGSFSDSQLFNIRDCSFTATEAEGGIATAAIRIGRGIIGTIERCDFDPRGKAQWAVTGIEAFTAHGGVKIDSCHFYRQTVGSIKGVNNAWTIMGSVFSGCYPTTPGSRVANRIYFDAGQNNGVAITGNYMADVDSAPNGWIDVTNGGNGLFIAGNFMDSSEANTAAHPCIRLTSSVRGAVIAANRFWGATGIHLASNPNGLIVVGNNFSLHGGNTAMTNGITGSLSTVTNATVLGNYGVSDFISKTWTNVTYNNGASGTLQVTKDERGLVHLTGRLNLQDGTGYGSSAVPVFTVPSGFRPQATTGWVLFHADSVAYQAPPSIVVQAGDGLAFFPRGLSTNTGRYLYIDVQYPTA